MSDISVVFPLQVRHPETVVPFAEFVLREGLERLWLGQSLNVDSHLAAAYLAGRGLRVPLGTSVTLMPLRHPYQAALEARSLAVLTGKGYVAGFGAGDPIFVENLAGRPYSSPRRAVGEYLSAMRALLDGRAVARDGEHFTVRGMLVPAEHPPVEVGAGVLRPAMARTAGAVADVAITWLVPPDYLGKVLAPALREGAHGRPRPPRVVSAVHVAVDRPGRDVHRLVRVATAAHVEADHYADMLRRAGVSDPTAPRELLEAGVFVTGAPEEIADRLRGFFAAGASEVVLNPGGVLATEGVRAATDDLTEVLEALRKMGVIDNR
ncbi:LLM class flavin-dependent oxidoreductase [Sphaerisporangium dianthi]|uniref:LLM class flavin-dependent oxidoreductase n=1 Tax=Sphaerisporangium dianthi TaxID=1436120 RepID=A0ABV9CPR4_9ACTN